jgi:serine protease Do
VRITNMRGVDIEKYRFDFDLTFGVLALNPDGTIYHRYGGRDSRSSGHWATSASFERMLTASLGAHREYVKTPAPPSLNAPLTTEKIPAFAKRDKGECIHCHNVHEGLQQESKDKGTWSFADIWVHPAPARLGLDLDRDDQRMIVEVEPDSAADKAGLLEDDLLISVGGTAIATATDLMAAAHNFPGEGGKLPVTFERDGFEKQTELILTADWKRETPANFAWRAMKWTLDPVPGFGGKPISKKERETWEIADGDYAFRTTYFVTWGPRAASGKRAGRAGLRAGDIVIEIAGKRDFDDGEHFHAWWRLTRKPGEIVPIHVIRNGERKLITLSVPKG